MRRFLIVFNVSQDEFDSGFFYQRKLNILTTLRKTHGVLVSVRETGRVFNVKASVYQQAKEHSIRRLDFSAPSEVTEEISRFPELKQALAINSQDKSVRYFGRTLTLNEIQECLYATQLEIVV